MKNPDTLKLVSWNVNGLRAVLKKGFQESITTLNPDILMLQETKLQENQRTESMINLANYQSFWNYSTIKKGYSGVVTYTRQTPDKVITNFDRHDIDQEGRIIQINIKDLSIFNIYFPNGQMNEERLAYKLDFYAFFLDYADSLRKKGKSLIICGDFNTAHNEIDLKNPGPNSKRSGFLPVEREILDQMTSNDYVDTFRHFYPEQIKYSWWSYRFKARENNAGWRIDYFFVTKDLINANRIKTAFIENDIFGSDHCPVGIEIIY